jgi:ZIP family zinc transporter
MDPMLLAMLYAAAGGATIPVGAWAARLTRVPRGALGSELEHGIVAFGGGVLLAAVALVLVPESLPELPPLWIGIAFAGGGLTFLLVDRAIAASGYSASQLIAMLLDFVPEAIALGAMLATGNRAGFLLAVLIALQNLPEGFNAYREVAARGARPGRGAMLAFTSLPLLGPVAAYAGFSLLARQPAVLAAIMLFASAGILYLTFQDIAPQARLRNHWAPALGAVAGFLVGLLGHVLVGKGARGDRRSAGA